MTLSLRLKWYLVTYGRVAALALLLVGIAATVGAAYVYTNPPTQDITEQEDIEQVSTSIHTSAVVGNNSTLYESGQRLVDQPVYVQDSTPELTFQIETDVPEGRDVTVTHRLTFRLSASRNDQVFWESNRLFVAESQVTDTGEAVTTTTVNMSAIAADVNQRRGQLGEIGQFRSEVALDVTYDTGRYEGQLTGTAPVVFTEQAYWVDGDISRSQSHSRTITRRVTGSPQPATYLGLGGLGASSFIAALSIDYLRRQDIDVSGIEMALLESRYEEWISNGQIVTDSDRKYVKIETLEDLVDLAIDSEKRVVYDDDFDVYAVVDEDLVYYYAREDHYVEDWLTV